MDDLKMIRTPSDWPCWPFLPLKRRTQRLENKDLGILVDDGKMLTIYFVYLFDLGTKPLKDAEKIEYETHHDMLDDGWRVD